MELLFKSDTKARKICFTSESFKHPAKMILPLQVWLIKKYINPGDIILDPMAGSGTVLIGTLLDRNIICVELEEKFCKIIEDNWRKLKQIGLRAEYKMGWAKILQGDARNLEGVLADTIITSPPYEATISDGGEGPLVGANIKKYGRRKDGTAKLTSYTQHEVPCKAYANTKYPYAAQNNKKNIGNLKKENYLEQMFLVYRQCWKVLKPEGLLILVVKNFIRNKQIVRLDLDTIKLCEQAGFSFVERHYRKLTQMSFWRTIYHQKYPEVEKLDKEDILIFKKEEIK